MFFLAVLDFQLTAFGIFMYSFAFLGSFSLGYLLLRTAFPEKQSLLASEKLQFGYLIGAPIIVISAIFGERYFFFVFTFISVLLFAIALTKRLSFKENDFVKLESVEKKSYIPEKALTKEERKAKAEGRQLPGRMVKQETYAPQPKKKIVAAEIKAINAPKEQVFKENNPNIQSSSVKTTEKEQDKLKEKEAVLKRLRELGKEAKKTKKKKTIEEIDEEKFKIEDLDFE